VSGREQAGLFIREKYNLFFSACIFKLKEPDKALDRDPKSSPPFSWNRLGIVDILRCAGDFNISSLKHRLLISFLR